MSAEMVTGTETGIAAGAGEIVLLREEWAELVGDSAGLLEEAEPREALEWAFATFGNRVTIATGFGAEGVALIDMAVDINPRADIFFLDTAFLFPETYELRRTLEDRYGITIRSVAASLTAEKQEEVHGPKLWERNPDLCCSLRKLEPLKRALHGFDAWVTAIRRDQSPARAAAQVVEWDGRWNLAKINPLVRWTRSEVWGYIVRKGLPYNPLHDRGYPSIGCTHCTQAVGQGEHERAGRWRGRNKTECGLHVQAAPTQLEHKNGDLAYERT